MIHCVSDKEIKIISQDSQVCQLNQQYTGEEKIITFYAISCSSFAGNINFLGFGDGSLCFYEFLVVIKTMIPTHNRALELFSLLKISLLMIVTLTQYSHRVLPSAQFWAKYGEIFLFYPQSVLVVILSVTCMFSLMADM